MSAAAIQTVRLAEVLAQSDRAIPSSDLPEVNLAGVYSFARGLFKRGPMRPAETSYKTYNRLVRDDFVISQPKAWEGALARVTDEFEGWFLSPVFPTFTADPRRLLPAYLEWFCKRKTVWQDLQILSKGMGARRETVSPEQFLSLEIPLPPLDEQRRIVARIEQLAAKVEEARRLRRASADEADAFTRSATDGAYKRLVAKVGLSRLQDACASITDGDHLTPAFSETGVKFIFVGNVSTGRLHFDRVKHVTPDYFKALSATRVPRRGDVLYSAVGATLGVPAVVECDENFCFQRHVAILKPDSKKASPRFLWHMLRSRTVFDKAWASTTGSAQPTIPLRAIRELPLPLPQLDEQHRIVAELDALQAKVDAVKALQTETAAELDAMLPAILDKAFKGEL